MLFASHAGAATTYDATLAGPQKIGSGYHFTYSIGEIPFDPTTYNAWSLTFTVNGLKYAPIVGITDGWMSPSNGLFGFQYNFLNPDTPTTLTVNAVINGYVGASVRDQSTFGLGNYSLLNYGDKTKMGTFNFNPISLSLFDKTAPQKEQPLPLKVFAEATPVPIGGTLPLMLTALGLGGWMLRARTKAA